MTPRLGVNIDHVATVRQARGNVPYPDPVAAAAICELAGADQITVHLREDRRHIQDRDVKLLKETVQTKLNLEMANASEIVKIAMYLKPDSACLVPERREEVTTEGGLDVQGNYDRLSEVIPALRNGNILVSLFIDPDVEQIKAAARLGAAYVEIHTGMYAEAKNAQEEADELEKIRHACGIAARLGFGVAAGHGLTYQNVRPIAAIPEVEELNIGHTIISRAVMTGVERAVRDMLEIIRGG